MRSRRRRTRLLGVTILTSFSAVDVERVWNKEILSVRDEVARLAGLAAEAGLHGVVTSPLEAESMKRRHGPEFLVVTPGIRPAGAGLGDQARTATPADAVRAGADFLVVGRPILEAADPAAVVSAIRPRCRWRPPDGGRMTRRAALVGGAAARCSALPSSPPQARSRRGTEPRAVARAHRGRLAPQRRRHHRAATPPAPAFPSTLTARPSARCRRARPLPASAASSRTARASASAAT
jgi:hypothetical protein